MSRKIRVILLDDNEVSRTMIERLMSHRGYEVLCYDDPSECPLQEAHECHCHDAQRCTDIMISDVDMKTATGLDFVESQIDKGCKASHIALMSGRWKPDEVHRAEKMGCTVFEKPTNSIIFEHWLDQCESTIDKDKQLNDWFTETNTPEDT